jgi:leucyl/phenylalanyl-tRNA--protein transferase
MRKGSTIGHVLKLAVVPPHYKRAAQKAATIFLFVDKVVKFPSVDAGVGCVGIQLREWPASIHYAYSMQPAREKPRFPPVEAAGPDGVLFVGGSLAPDWMLEAYRRGIFPMPIRVEGRRLIAWLSPDPRGVLEFEDLHISRRLARRLRRGEFQFTINQAFREVVEACAAPRDCDGDCWLTLAMQNAYVTLHSLGHAHSVEVWRDGRLVGGLFGVAIGAAFAAESKFHRVTDASKAAVAFLVEHLKKRGYRLLDVQWTNAHTRRLGARDIPRAAYISRLTAAVSRKVGILP